jgi:hypothetical protein
VHKDIKGSSMAARAQGHHWGQGGTITGKKRFGYLGDMEKRVIFASGIYIYK